jgi:SAM-dependent MidA family methyltransferase
VTSAADELRRMIEADGPLSIAAYMSFCLTHPRFGYYATRDPFGVTGDFTTAPEISQMFGELIGLWAASVWLEMAAPQPLVLAELGPGRGTLMADALRAIGQVPQFRGAPPRVHLVETSAHLRERQRQTLAPSGAEISWHDDVASLPDAPMIVIANEFFDALPMRQAVKTADGWHERLVGLGPDAALTFGLAPHAMKDAGAMVPARLQDAEEGAIFEWRDQRIASDLAHRVARQGGAALVIDYGHIRSALGDTLQAVRRHAFDGVLAHPGDADLTAHVDFEALADVAKHANAKVAGPMEQGTFLRALGIETRAAKLKAAQPPQGRAIDAALDRLTGRGPGQMGALFKVLAFSHPALTLPGFE